MIDKDPRQEAKDAAMDSDPIVGASPARMGRWMVGGTFAVLAVALFLILNERRLDRSASLVTPTANQAPAAAPPPLDIPKPKPALAAPPAPPPQMVAPPPPPPPPDDSAQRLHAPAVVVDLQAGQGMPVVIPATAPSGGSSGPATAGPPPANSATAMSAAGPAAAARAALAAVTASSARNSDEQFAARVSDENAQASVATQMTNLRTTVIQGATIQAVLETAINSDLPGYIRAVVRRDVLGFDGKAVLIQRGSRVIGQYRNALSLGQSRVFVIWTRIVRPDGVTVQIGSPGGDSLGQGGLTGDVSTHFFDRFSGAILLSVLNAGTNAVSRAPSTEIAIGSPAAALSAAATATVPQGADIAPTVKVEQGSSVTIFVARDLDFSSVKPIDRP